MSEEILKALMHLFAIISKQDDGVNEDKRNYVRTFLSEQLSEKVVSEYLVLFDEYATDNKKKEGKSRTSVLDSVKTLSICKRINKTLAQQQKIVVLTRLFELVNADKKFTQGRLEIIDTAADVFNISKEEYSHIENFVIKEKPLENATQDLVVIDSQDGSDLKDCKHIQIADLNGRVLILKVSSVDLYFLKFDGVDDAFLNGLPLKAGRIYLFANGSTVKFSKAKPLYYSDVVAHYMSDSDVKQLTFVADDIVFKFPNGAIGLRHVNVKERSGKLIGLMGASGAGKTTLLNVLSGIETPSSGTVKINGYDIHKDKKEIEGVIGYIPQDDLLIEELTVYQNLYYNAKLCFKSLNEEELHKRVIVTLKNLGLEERKDLRVGNPLDKTISGGQRKRLNIALELIREPSVLFVDEPTSGLSSRDSENVMDLLRELALKGKLIFVVIHQPSSDIYKMFDKIVFLDVGGYQVYYGNPVEAINYFKNVDHQVIDDEGECPNCGTVNPELTFNILEAQVVDEFGQFTGERKISPIEWNVHFNKHTTVEEVEQINEQPPKALDLPNKFKQFLIFSTRDILSKLGNTQYLLINFLEAPLLAFVLSFIIRYVADTNSNEYLFSKNDNIPAYLFMSIIVALFMGLTVSAEEIFRDRKILKRESFLNLSKLSYLVSKMGILFFVSAIQTLTFVLVGNYILGIKGMMFDYWIMLFSISCFANMLGLNISATFNSAVTIYILIPILLIPQMILSGAIFSFDKINDLLGRRDKVPMIAEVMASRWAFEGLVVDQFKNNEFTKLFYELEKRESNNDFQHVFLIPELISKINASMESLNSEQTDSSKKIVAHELLLIHNEIEKKQKNLPEHSFDYLNKLTIDSFNEEVAIATIDYLVSLQNFYLEKFNAANREKDQMISLATNTDAKKEVFDRYKKLYTNESLSDIVKNVAARERLIELNNELIQQIDLVYLDPNPANSLDIRTHFYAPRKHFMGKLFDTFWFNTIIIWLMSLILFITLFFDGFLFVLELPGKINFKAILPKRKVKKTEENKEEDTKEKEEEKEANNDEEEKEISPEKAARRARREAARAKVEASEASSLDEDPEKAARRARREAAKAKAAEQEGAGESKTEEDAEKAARRARKEAAKAKAAKQEAKNKDSEEKGEDANNGEDTPE